MSFEYVRDHYGVPAQYGRLVTVNGKPGIIIKDLGHHIGVNFDDDKPGIASPCHPVWEVEYGGIGTPRKPTKSQSRYQRYLKSDSVFDSFLHFCYWDAEMIKKYGADYA